jgi:hypothetical protein
MDHIFFSNFNIILPGSLPFAEIVFPVQYRHYALIHLKFCHPLTNLISQPQDSMKL